MFLVKRDNFNKSYIIKGLITALFFSASIYLDYFSIEYKLLNSIIGLISIYLFLTIEKKALFFVGFFIGLFWFYWIGNSFEYYGFEYLKYFGFIPFAIGYGIIFYLISLYDNIFFRAAVLLFLSYIQPLGFNWFIPEIIFTQSFFMTTKPYFALIVASVLMLVKLNYRVKILAIIPLYFALSNQGVYIDNSKLSIDMPNINLNQSYKWDKRNFSNIAQKNLDLITKAIQDKKDLVILPETAFPIVLNYDNFLMYNLIENSKHIDIITGALYAENGDVYNATYHFNNGKFNIAKKVVLVPFGEEIPLPKFLVNFINDTFYNGAKDYKKAKIPTDFNIKGEQFRNAICYEATKDEIYQNLNGIKYIIATSNNAWFTPSIQPNLQKMLLKYYATKYNVTIFHSINGSKNYIIRP